MAKHKYNRDVGRGMKVLQHSSANAIGPLANPRHPKKFTLAPKPQAPGDMPTSGARGEEDA